MKVKKNSNLFNDICLPLVPSSSLAWQYIDNKVFIIDDYRCFVVCLESVSALLWKELISGNNLNDIIQMMKKKYNVSENVLECDVYDFVIELKEKGLIKEKESGE